MNSRPEKPETEIRPWYREPWPWILIALPLSVVVASAVTYYLAVSHPDYLVVKEDEYKQISEELRPSPTLGREQHRKAGAPDRDDGNS